VQYRAATAQALRGEESGGAQRTARFAAISTAASSPTATACISHSKLAGQARFDLFRLVRQHGNLRPESGGRIDACGSTSATRPSRRNSFRPGSGNSGGSGFAVGRLGFVGPMFIDAIFSSFIIGEGAVTAFFILMVR
jgi:hypothetical protein